MKKKQNAKRKQKALTPSQKEEKGHDFLADLTVEQRGEADMIWHELREALLTAVCDVRAIDFPGREAELLAALSTLRRCDIPELMDACLQPQRIWRNGHEMTDKTAVAR